MMTSKYDKILTKEFFQNEYLNTTQTLAEISIKHNITLPTIIKYKHKHNISNKSQQSYNNGKYNNVLTKEFLYQQLIIENKTIQQLFDELHIDKTTIRKYLKKYGIILNSRTVLGQRFGNLLVLEKTGRILKGFSEWKCICDCGNTAYRNIRQLRVAGKTSCGCNMHNKGVLNHSYTGTKNITGLFFSHIRTAAHKRNLPFLITINEIEELWQQQNSMCALSGVPIALPVGWTGKKTASLDRIDSTLGYTLDNVQWVHKDINMMKFDLDNIQFINLCNLITNPLSYNILINHNVDILYSIFRTCKYNADKRKILFNITQNDLLQQFIKQNGCCAITGQKLILPYKYNDKYTASIDRVNNAIGYTIDNIQWVHKIVQMTRKKLSIDSYQNWARLVVKYNRINITPTIIEYSKKTHPERKITCKK